MLCVCVCFNIEGSDPVQDVIEVHNRGSYAVAYRIRSSVQGKFIIRPGDGVLEAGARTSVSVVLKSFPQSGEVPADGVLAKFAVDFLQCDDSFYVGGSRAFWSARGDSSVTRKIVGVAVPVEVAPSVLVESSLEDCVSVSPDALRFMGAYSPIFVCFLTISMLVIC